MPSGSDYVSTLNGILFAPWRAWKLANQEFVSEVDALLTKLYPGKTPAELPAVGDLAQILQGAVLARQLTPAPVLREYSGTDDFSLQSQDSKDDKIGGSVGVNITAVPVVLSLTGSHDQTSSGSTAQAHHLAYSIETPLPDGDAYSAAAAYWLKLRQLAAAPPAPAHAGQ